ncbi:hypothetical protein ACWC24_41255 [Streptomyces sp. NPDC001443]
MPANRLASPGDIEDLDGWTLHRLRHSALTHDAEDGTSTPMLLARSRHACVRSLERYARPGVDERASGPGVPATLRERICELQGELCEACRAGHEEFTGLRRSVGTLAQRVQALALDNEQL